MLSRTGTAVALLLAAVAARARAQHPEAAIPQPVTPVPDAGIAPREPTDIRLRSAEIEIVLDKRPHGAPERRRIAYVLSNPGRERDLRVGFRFKWYTEASRFAVPQNLLEPDADATLGDGRRVRCEEFADVRWDDVPPPYASAGGHASAWCVWTMRVPPGESRWHLDVATEGNDAAFEDHGAVLYSLAAEAAWPGHPDVLAISITAARSWRRPILAVSPGSAALGDRRIAWRFQRPDVAGLGGVVATYDRYRELEEGASPIVRGTGFAISASSVLAPQARMRFDPSLVVDADPATAWCEGAPGTGGGEWLEARTNLDPAAAARCKLDAFLIVPGFGRSNTSWSRTGRVTRFQIASCADAADAIEVRLAPPESRAYVHPAKFWPLGTARGEPLATEKACYRLTILDVTRGKDPDTCVSEFVPLFSCAR